MKHGRKRYSKRRRREKEGKRVSIGLKLYFYLFERLELDELPELLLEKLGSSRSMSLQEKRT